MSAKPPKPVRRKIRGSLRIAVIASRFNPEIADELLRACLQRLAQVGVPSARIEVHRVPGAFELPLSAKLAAKTGKFAAIICLGVVIRGQTPHFDFVAGEAARGIQQVGLETGVPVIFGVLTTNTEKQARQRIVAGRRAADAAVEMIELKSKLQ
ncbi:MAG: 6,7-dimethyl-8-ribityllumazine synthase [Tepidisphaeraceae bacterium]|jgi:6,7-dimethyl-8-ribityllumazine synthase